MSFYVNARVTARKRSWDSKLQHPESTEWWRLEIRVSRSIAFYGSVGAASMVEARTIAGEPVFTDLPSLSGVIAPRNRCGADCRYMRWGFRGSGYGMHRAGRMLATGAGPFAAHLRELARRRPVGPTIESVTWRAKAT